MDSWNFAYFYDNIAESSFPISTKSVIIFTCLQFTYSGLLFRLIRLTVYTGFTWIALPIIKKCQIIKNIDTWTFIENCVKTAIDNSFFADNCYFCLCSAGSSNVLLLLRKPFSEF